MSNQKTSGVEPTQLPDTSIHQTDTAGKEVTETPAVKKPEVVATEPSAAQVSL